MLGRSWFTVAGSVALVATLATGVADRPAARAVGPPAAEVDTAELADLAACGREAVRAIARRTSWSATPTLDRAGTLSGWAVAVEVLRAEPLRFSLPPESSVSEPVDGLAVVTADDGTRSTIAVVSAAGRCATRIAIVDVVVRSGILRRRDGAVWFHAVDRSSRRDLGVWSVTAPNAEPVRIIAALGAHDPSVRRVGRVFHTSLRLSGGGERLAVQSCGERICRTRIVDLASRQEWRIDGPTQGPLVGFDGARATFGDPCHERRCPVRTVVFDHVPTPPETESPR